MSKKYIIAVLVLFVGAVFATMSYRLYQYSYGGYKSFKDVSIGVDSSQAIDRDQIFDSIIKSQIGIKNQFSRLFDENFFEQENAFQEIKLMRTQMEKRIQKRFGRRISMLNPFDYLFADKFGGRLADISTREDENFIYYDIVINNLHSQLVSTKVNNGFVTITTISQNKDESQIDSNKKIVEELSESETLLARNVDTDIEDVHEEQDQLNHHNVVNQNEDYTEFIQTLPRPPKTEAGNIQIINEKDKVILAFPKLKG